MRVFTNFCFYTKNKKEKVEIYAPEGVHSLKGVFKSLLFQYKLYHIYCTCDTLCSCENGYIVEDSKGYATPLLRINEEGEEEEILIYPNLGLGLYNLE